MTVMFTYLHHSDPTIPHYRKEEWSFLRGAAATVDRPLLGWAVSRVSLLVSSTDNFACSFQGRFFFHNISHDHIAHRKSTSMTICLSVLRLLTYRLLRWRPVL